MRRLLALVALLLCALGCGRKAERFDERIRPPVSLWAISPEVYAWESGETLSIFNDCDEDNAAVALEDECATIDLPEQVSRLYALSPYSAASQQGPGKAVVTIPLEQSQRIAGRPGRGRYPMWASAAVVEDCATFHFKPLAVFLSLDLYKSQGDGTEQLRSVRLLPHANAGIAGTAVLDLRTQGPLSFTAGDSGSGPVRLTAEDQPVLARSRAAAQRLFLVLARQQYGALTLEVQSTRSLYTIDLSGSFTMDGTVLDQLPLSIDLSTGEVTYSPGGVDHASEKGRVLVSSGDFTDLSLRGAPDTLTVECIPDFSRVGYHYGDIPIPDRAVTRTISVDDVAAAIASGAAADTTDFLQKTLDEMGQAGGGVLLLRDGVYNTSRILFMDSDNLVIRGESREGTVIRAVDTNQRVVVAIGATVSSEGYALSETRTSMAGRLVSVSNTKLGGVDDKTVGTVMSHQYNPVNQSRKVLREGSSAVSEDYVPFGRMYVEVTDASGFAPGDRVVVYRPATLSWIHDIWMDRIAWNGRTEETGGSTVQWSTNPSRFDKYWERRVVAVSGKKVYLDTPLVMALQKQYGGGMLYHISWQRVYECGIENLTLDCAYDPSKVYTAQQSSRLVGQPYDEAHAWSAVRVSSCEHCWVRDVTSYHMGMSCVYMAGGARCVTVENCRSLDPVSVILGSRRYAFEIGGGELMLIKNCYTLYDRHSFVSGGTCGPNVFVDCVAEKCFNGIGPHLNWATGTLYDCVKSDGSMEAQDAGNGGTGHGWRGANIVYWNCECSTLHCQTPQASARNYAIGTIGKKGTGSNYNGSYFGEYVDDPYMQAVGYITVGGNKVSRPDGEWYPFLDYLEKGTEHVTLPHDSGKDWWPRLSLTSFSNPLSLYQCQLEDRHARGVYLGNL